MASTLSKLLPKIDRAIDDTIPEVEEIKCVRGLRLRLTGVHTFFLHDLQLNYNASVRGYWEDPIRELQNRGVTGKITMLAGTGEKGELHDGYNISYPKAELEINLYFDFRTRSRR